MCMYECFWGEIDISFVAPIHSHSPLTQRPTQGVCPQLNVSPRGCALNSISHPGGVLAAPTSKSSFAAASRKHARIRSNLQTQSCRQQVNLCNTMIIISLWNYSRAIPHTHTHTERETHTHTTSPPSQYPGSHSTVHQEWSISQASTTSTARCSTNTTRRRVCMLLIRVRQQRWSERIYCMMNWNRNSDSFRIIWV